MKTKLINELKTDGPAKCQKLLDPEIKAKIKASISVCLLGTWVRVDRYCKNMAGAQGNRDEKIRNRYHGRNDELASSIIGRVEERTGANIAPPVDRSITTLWVGGVDESLRCVSIYSRLLKSGRL
jgi:hypothetical protein